MPSPQFREGQQIALGTHHAQIRWLRIALMVVAVFAMFGMAAGAFGLYAARQTSENNCVRIHRLTVVGAEIIADRDSQGRPGKSLNEFRREGLLSRAQFDREMAALTSRLERWDSADCPPPPEPEKTPK